MGYVHRNKRGHTDSVLVLCLEVLHVYHTCVFDTPEQQCVRELHTIHD